MHVRGLCDVGGEKIEESFFSDQKTATNTHTEGKDRKRVAQKDSRETRKQTKGA